MKPTDRSPREASLEEAWRSLSHRLAVAAGSLVGLVSLFHHVPVSTASLRGAGIFFAVLLVSRLGLAALQRAMAFQSDGTSDRETSG